MRPCSAINQDSWLSHIPSDWYTDRLKDIIPRIVGGGTPASTNPDFWEDGDIVWVTPTDFSKNGGTIEICDSDRNITRAGLNASSAVLLPKNSVIMASRATIGAVRIARTDLATNQGFVSFVCDETKLHHRFLYYVIAGYLGEYFAEIAPGTTFREIGRGEVKREAIGFPSLPEQQRIAAYLDASCAAIDAAVAAKRRQLETLDGVVQTVIADAVTKGLKRGVAMRPSGLDWLSEVPRHWDICQVKRRCTLLRGKFSHRPRNDPALYDGDYPFVQTGDITAADKYITTYSQTLNEQGFSVSKMFPKGTLVMSIAANIGDVAILNFEACFPDSMVGLLPDHKTNLDFLFYLMRAMKGIMLRSAVLTTQLNINYVRIGTNFAPFPPKREQEEIAEFLDYKLAEVKGIVATIESQIATLTAYRKSLIHECITGQRRITETDVQRPATQHRFDNAAPMG